MTALLSTISEIVKYGLQPNLSVPDKERELERSLVNLYRLYFDIVYPFDETDYPDFDRSSLPDVRQNVISNFKDFGYYKVVLDSMDLNLEKGTAIGDAVDDLTDIIGDLFEIKWRIEQNSEADGLWYFQHIFQSHTQQHLLDLLNYLKQKNG